jgi:hypothetical protein
MMLVRKSFITLTLISTMVLPAAYSEVKELNISGVVEGEYSSTEEYGGGGNSSDIVAATAALAFEAKLSKGFTAVAEFLFEEDATPYDVESGYIMREVGNFTLQAGRFFVPFGVFDTNMVSDPLTLEIAETNEAAFMFSYGTGPVVISAYTFNGDAKKDSQSGDYVNNYGFNIGFEHGHDEHMMFTASLGYISNIADSDGLTGVATLADGVKDYVAGYALSTNFTFGDFGLIAEYIKAAKAFDKTSDLATGATPAAGAEPAAFNIEASYGFGDFTFALGMQKSEDLAGTLAESRTMFAVAHQCSEDVSMALEYLMEDDYETALGQTGKDKNTITIQMAAEF